MCARPDRGEREARRDRMRAEWRDFWRPTPEDQPRASSEERWRDDWRGDWRTRWRSGGRERGMPRFMRGIGCMFALLILSAAFAGGILTTLAARVPERALWIMAIAGLVAFMLVSAFVATFRKVALKFRAQVLLRRQLLADVAHELRTPLAIVQGRLEGLLDGVYPRSEEELQRLLKETRHLGRLVDDIGTLANAEAGALELRKERTDLAELARDIVASFDRPIALDLGSELPALEIDAGRIREVLLNLLTNAARHTPADGRITLRVETEPRQVVLHVEDTGSGIPPEELPQIFQRFHKGAGSTGSGLGLAISRDLVRAHGGNIRAASVVGRGTTLTITLPR